MSNVADWLENLGLGKYAEVFAENDIDIDVLAELNDTDLNELGISLGDRKRLLKAIATQCSSDTSTSEATAGKEETLPLQQTSASTAERRQLTVMFVDLIDSTALSTQYDPEDFSAIVRDYQDACAGVISRYAGYLAKYMGDGILIYFGYPQAHEDDVERALHAGLDLIKTVGQLKPHSGLTLQTRVGVATGLVVVGETVGDASAQEQVVMGETPNLAARLQTLARPNSLVIGHNTRRLAGELFEYAALGEHWLKGFDQPMTAYRVIAERLIESRFAARSGQLMPLVGREQELALLLERWRQADAGEGQVVLLTGEAGIGKSRIVQALVDELKADNRTRMHFQCSSYHSGSALWPVIQHLTAAAEIDVRNPVEQNLDKLEALLAQAVAETAPVAPLIASLLGLAGESRYGGLELTPQAQRMRTLAVLTEQLLGLAAKQPVLMVFEDVHWIDPTTWELIELCIEAIATARVMILITNRPEDTPELISYPYVTRITLNRLSRESVEALVTHLTQPIAPFQGLVETIVKRSDGVPLFVEEITKAAIKTGDQQEIQVPASLHDSLMARLDGIPQAKEIAQIAAIIGRDFDYPLLSRIAHKPAAVLDEALEQLTHAELIFRRGAVPDAHYAFKHALLRDAAYESLLLSKRQELHSHVADSLRDDDYHTPPELLAYHLSEAGLVEQAAEAWAGAGQQALGRSAMREASRALEQALKMVRRLPDSITHIQQKLELLGSLGVAYTNIKGPAAPEVERVQTEAASLAAGVQNNSGWFRAYWNLWRVHNARGDLSKAAEQGRELLVHAKRQSSRDLQMQAHHAIWSSQLFLGNLEQVRQHVDLALEIYDEKQHGADALIYGGHDAAECGLVQSGNALLIMGYPEQAFDWNRRGLSHALKLAHPQIVAHSQNWGLSLLQLLGAFDELSERIESIKPMVERYGLAIYYTEANMVEAWLAVRSGSDRRSAEMIREQLDRRNAMGTGYAQTYFLLLAADAWLRLGEPREALTQVEEGLRRAAVTDERLFSAELERLKGQALLAVSRRNTDLATVAFQSALANARKQSARFFELRAACDLARLWFDQGKRQEAIDLLTPVYNWFTEGFDTADLKNAKALLDELA